MTHRTSPEFWHEFYKLPPDVQVLARKNFALLQSDPSYPSLEFKRIGRVWSARVGLHYRTLSFDDPDEENGLVWFWIGSHAEYDRILKNL